MRLQVIEQRLAAFSARLDRLCGVLAMVALVIMLAAILVQIVARYVFAAPPPWTEELARYAMIWAGMLGATMAYYRRADPVLFAASTAGRPGRALAMLSIEMLALVAFVAPVLWFAPAFLERHARRITETLEINSALVVAIVPLSLVVLLVHQAARVIAAVRAVRAGVQP
jgi:TRAP-type C4-dicarboxylate transport system permease small subunit